MKMHKLVMTSSCHQTYELRAKDAKQAKKGTKASLVLPVERLLKHHAILI